MGRGGGLPSLRGHGQLRAPLPAEVPCHVDGGGCEPQLGEGPEGRSGHAPGLSDWKGGP